MSYKHTMLILLCIIFVSCSSFEKIRVNSVAPEQEIVILGPKRNLTKIWEDISKDFPNGPTKKIINAFNINDNNALIRRSFEQWIYDKKDIVTIVSIVDGKLNNIITIHKEKGEE